MEKVAIYKEAIYKEAAKMSDEQKTVARENRNAYLQYINKNDEWTNARKDVLKNEYSFGKRLKGLAKSSLIGGGVGAGVGGLGAAAYLGNISKKTGVPINLHSKDLPKFIGMGAALGASAGSNVGAAIGSHSTRKKALKSLDNTNTPYIRKFVDEHYPNADDKTKEILTKRIMDYGVFGFKKNQRIADGNK